MKIELTNAQSARPNTDWFMSVGGTAIYRRGTKGLCLDMTNGKISSVDYGGSVGDVFDNPEQYTPLYPGTEITITL